MSGKKSEGKERNPPCTPYREKGKRKEKTKTGTCEYSPRPRARACTQEEARLAVDDVLKNFGTEADRRLWMWYCLRLGLNKFFDIFDWTLSDFRQREIKWPVKAFQKRLMEALPKGGAGCL